MSEADKILMINSIAFTPYILQLISSEKKNTFCSHFISYKSNFFFYVVLRNNKDIFVVVIEIVGIVYFWYGDIMPAVSRGATWGKEDF